MGAPEAKDLRSKKSTEPTDASSTVQSSPRPATLSTCKAQTLQFLEKLSQLYPKSVWVPAMDSCSGPANYHPFQHLSLVFKEGGNQIKLDSACAVPAQTIHRAHRAQQAWGAASAVSGVPLGPMHTARHRSPGTHGPVRLHTCGDQRSPAHPMGHYL